MTTSPALSQGLTSTEVAERIRLGRVNRTRHSHWADYAGILRRNLFTLFNFMVLPAAVALFCLGEIQGGIAVSGMAVTNSVLGLLQEIRAKHHLDKLAILVEAHVRVRRDGQPNEIPAGDVVLGDHILLQSGETVVADGAVLEAQFLEVDEALLTGESDPVRREAGNALLSGSFCVAGEGVYRADRVGVASFAQNTSAQARLYRYADSPLTRVINILIQVLSATAVALIGVYFLLFWLGGVSDAELVRRIASTLTSMVPQGLVLTATVSFTLGAVVMSQRGAIVQRLNAVEAMAAIDVICTDKTGTLTTNRLSFARLRPLADGLAEEEVRQRPAVFASVSVDRQNKNIQALCAALGEVQGDLLDQIPFKSQNRYSAVHVRLAGTEHFLVLGAPEALAETLDSKPWQDEAAAWQREGLRTLLFADGVEGVMSTAGLPPLRPLALVGLSDELRPDAGKVLEALAAQGIAFKVISGDNAETVRATVGSLHLPLAHEPVVSGSDLERSEGEDRDKLILTHSVFGRVAPQQKVEIVEALQRQGRLVAMIGDGVNDVLPIKRADLGIAMGEGSQASKTVAGLVLENNDFALLPETLEEGRTIVRNLRWSSKLFLVKNVYSLILILGFALGWLGVPFPYVPQQVTLLNWLVIGIPAFVIALTRERSTTGGRRDVLREVGSFALRSGVVFGAAGLTVLWLAVHVWSYDEKVQRTMLLSVLIALGITALLRVLGDGENGTQPADRRVRWLAAASVPAYLLAMYVPLSAEFFELATLSATQWLQVGMVALPAWLLTVLSDNLFRGQGSFRLAAVRRTARCRPPRGSTNRG